MTKQKNTKRALLASVLSMMLCMAMLVGSTFAWFTDSVTSGKNRIVAGNLDVELYHSNGNVTAEKVGTETMLFKSKDGENVRWEPGVMVYENFTVKNEGSLALKYKLTLNAEYNTVDGRSLADVLKVAILNKPFSGEREEAVKLDFESMISEFEKPGKLAAGDDGKAGDTYAVVIYWEPSANDNDYNFNNERKDFESLYVDFGVTLVATQDTVEMDSFDEKYDENAKYPYVVNENEVVVTPETASSLRLEDNTTYYFEAGTYQSLAYYLHGKKNIAFIGQPGAVVNGDITVGYHLGQDGSLPLKSNSTLLVSGFTVNGELKAYSADQRVIVADNTAHQINVYAEKIDQMNILVEGNTVDGIIQGSQGYGLYIVPSVTDYSLRVTGNTFRNISSHVISVQGCGQASSVTAAKSIQVKDNIFESWGTSNKDNRGAFKIWADTRYAPQSISDESGLTEDAKTLVRDILAGNNTYMSDRENTVKFEFYGYGFNELSSR